MNNQKMGAFISALRKRNHMTQKDLAAKLNITDKAVSKWERGLSCPDISLLSSLAEILGVSTNELLKGEESPSHSKATEISIDNALQYAHKTVHHRVKSVQSFCAVWFTLLLFLGILTCAICDIAISGTFTWSLYPIASSVFAWLVFFPVIKFGKKGILGTMISLTVFIMPFMYVLEQLVQVSDLILPVSIRVVPIALVYLWLLFILFTVFKTKKLLATSLALFLTIPLDLLINFSLSKVISQPPFSIWDIFSSSVIAAMGILLLVFYFIRDKKQC